MRKVQVECLVFRKVGNRIEYLLLKRIKQKGGFWQPISGGVETEDRSIKDAALRELLEEANITKKDILNIIKGIYYFEFDRHYITREPIPKLKEYVLGFEVKPDIKVSINKNIYTEHEKFGWFSFSKAMKHLKWKDNKVALKKLDKLVKR